MIASGSPAISARSPRRSGLRARRTLADIYDDRFLPPRDERMPLK